MGHAVPRSCRTVSTIEHSFAAPPSKAAPLPLPGCGEFNARSQRKDADRPNSRDEFQDDRPTKVASGRAGCETLTLVSPMSRRELLAATASVVGGGLAGARRPRPRA